MVQAEEIDDDQSFNQLSAKHSLKAANLQVEPWTLLAEEIAEEMALFITSFRRRRREVSDDDYINPLGIDITKKQQGSTDNFVKKHGDPSQHEFGEKEEEEEEDKKLKRQKKKKKKKTGRKRCFESEGEIQTKPKKRRRIIQLNFRELGLDPPPDHTLELKARIGTQVGDTEMKLVIMKQLFYCDISTHHDRLSIPLNQIKDRENFLIGKEKSKLQSKGSIGVQFIEVIETDKTHTSKLRLRQWKMNSTSPYVLSGWKAVLERNKKGLKENAIVQLYSFRRNGKLWLVLKKIRDAESSDDGCGAGMSQENVNNHVVEQALHQSIASASKSQWNSTDGASTSQA